MYTLLIIIHLFVSFIMIGAILLQAGKGAEIGAAFGGSSQTIFGSRGAATFLSKMTVGAAIIFMLTSLSLAFLSRERAGEHSIMKNSVSDTVPSSSASIPQTPTAQIPQATTTAPVPATIPAGSAGSIVPSNILSGAASPSSEKK